MYDNIIDYIISDLYVVLALTDRLKMLNEYQRETHDIPVHVDLGEHKFTMNREGELDSKRNSPSFVSKRIVMDWGILLDTRPDTLAQHHRDTGPAEIILEGVRKWHQNGRLHRVGKPAIQVETARFVWYKNDRAFRDNGPYGITLQNVRIEAQHGLTEGIQVGGMNMDWNLPSGKRVPDSVFKRAIAKAQQEEIEFELTNTGSVFKSDMDQMMFWSLLRDE